MYELISREYLSAVKCYDKESLMVEFGFSETQYEEIQTFIKSTRDHKDAKHTLTIKIASSIDEGYWNFVLEVYGDDACMNIIFYNNDKDDIGTKLFMEWVTISEE